MTGTLLLMLLAIAPPQGDIHVDARDHPVPGAGEAAFAAMERALVRGFDHVCGDTFCEGEYGNLRALQLRCAVSREAGTVSECLWSFAGSNAWVDEGTALPSVHYQAWACRLPVVPGTGLSTLLSSLSGPDALDTPLPGGSLSTYDTLIDCL